MRGRGEREAEWRLAGRVMVVVMYDVVTVRPYCGR